MSERGRRYKQNVALACAPIVSDPLACEIALTLDVFPPDNRRRDLDNVLKAIFDALGDAGIYEDDSQIKHLDATMRGKVRGGLIAFRIDEWKGTER